MPIRDYFRRKIEPPKYDGGGYLDPLDPASIFPDIPMGDITIDHNGNVLDEPQINPDAIGDLPESRTLVQPGEEYRFYLVPAVELITDGIYIYFTPTENVKIDIGQEISELVSLVFGGTGQIVGPISGLDWTKIASVLKIPKPYDIGIVIHGNKLSMRNFFGSFPIENSDAYTVNGVETTWPKMLFEILIVLVMLFIISQLGDKVGANLATIVSLAIGGQRWYAAREWKEEIRQNFENLHDRLDDVSAYNADLLYYLQEILARIGLKLSIL